MPAQCCVPQAQGKRLRASDAPCHGRTRRDRRHAHQCVRPFLKTSRSSELWPLAVAWQGHKGNCKIKPDDAAAAPQTAAESVAAGIEVHGADPATDAAAPETVVESVAAGSEVRGVDPVTEAAAAEGDEAADNQCPRNVACPKPKVSGRGSRCVLHCGTLGCTTSQCGPACRVVPPTELARCVAGPQGQLQAHKGNCRGPGGVPAQGRVQEGKGELRRLALRPTPWPARRDDSSR